MDQIHQDGSKTALYDLIYNLDLQIQVFLFSIGIFNESDMDHIKSGVTQQEQRLKLLNILQGRQYEEAHLFNALEKCNQTYLLDKLKSALLALKNNQILHKKIAQELKDPDSKFDEIRISKLWEVPHRNPYFTGRHSLLEEVSACLVSKEQPQMEQGAQKKLSQSHVTVISACQGMGGVGKTQLAIEFVHRYKDVYPYVFWIPAESSSRIEIGYQKLAHDLKMDTEQPIDAIVREIKGWFHRHPGCLLIYDNASNAETIKDYLPLTGCHIIVTSRNTEWHWLSNSISITVDVFTVDEARQYFQKLLGDQLDIKEMDTLAALLGYLPLALAQAVAFIKNSKMTILNYIDLYKKQKEKLLADKSLPKFHHVPVFVSFDITMEVIQKKSCLAVQLLNVSAYLHNEDIPNIVLQVLGESPKDNPHSEIYERARGILDIYSMIRVNSEKGTVSIHPILQEVVRLQLKNQNKHDVLFDVRGILLKIFPKGQNLDDYKNKISMISHMAAVLGHIDDGLYHTALNEPLIISDLLTNLQEAYFALGDYRKQRDCLERALKIEELHYGTDHPDVAKTLTNLGTAYGKLGDHAKHREYLERGLNIFEFHYGPNHPQVAKTLTNLGSAYLSMGDYRKMHEYLERALKIEESYYSPDHPEVAMTLMNLGIAYGCLGDYTKQCEHLERALTIFEAHYDPDHPEVGRSLTNLGNTYGNLGNYAKKREYLERALKIKELHYGPDHPEIADTLMNLGNAFGELGDYINERQCLEGTLKIEELHYGPDHPRVARTLGNLGVAYGDLGDYSKEREYLERALKIKELHYGPDHPEVASTLCNLGNAYGRLGDYTKQRQYLEDALRIEEAHYGSDHPEVAATLTNLGNAYENLRDYRKQREYLERALKIKELHYGLDHPEVAITLNNIGNAYANLGDYSKSREYLERALKIKESYYGREHPEVARTLANLGISYGSLGDYTKQREHLDCALRIFEAHYSLNHPEVAIILDNLGNACRSLGDYSKSREYLERALKIKEVCYGSDHPQVGIALNTLGHVCESLGDHEKQRDCLKRALPIYVKRFGFNHVETAKILKSLANTYGNMGGLADQQANLARAFANFDERGYLQFGKKRIQVDILSTEFSESSTGEIVRCCLSAIFEANEGNETFARKIIPAVRSLKAYNKFGGVLHCLVGPRGTDFSTWKQDGSYVNFVLPESDIQISIWIAFPGFIAKVPDSSEIIKFVRNSDICLRNYFELMSNFGGTWTLIASETKNVWALEFEEKGSINKYEVELKNNQKVTAYQCCRYEGTTIDINDLDPDDETLQALIMSLVDETNYDILANNILKSLSELEPYINHKSGLRCIVADGYAEYFGACTEAKVFSLQVEKTHVTILTDNVAVPTGTIDNASISEFAQTLWLNANHSNDHAFGEFLKEMKNRFPENKWSFALIHGSSDKFAVATTASSDINYFVAKFANKETVIIWPT